MRFPLPDNQAASRLATARLKPKPPYALAEYKRTNGASHRHLRVNSLDVYFCTFLLRNQALERALRPCYDADGARRYAAMRGSVWWRHHPFLASAREH